MTPPPGPEPPAAQRVVTIRRDYNAWVASETLEDYALRFTPHAFRKWSVWRVANTAFGASSFLVLEAVGATLLVQYGFLNAFWAILATGLVIFLAGWPISVYAARHGVDMDLLTRGAGFGYLGSTLTSLIYASFTFIFFALEAAIMAYALELAFDIPPAWGYLLCALGVLPVVTHGVTAISTLQVWTQPLWLVLLVLPYGYVLQHNPQVLQGLVQYGGGGGQAAGFQLQGFGAAMTVGIALITQMGEQVDYLRFMPERTTANRRAWDAAVLVGGPGWVVPGVLKMLGGALLAYLAISHMVPAERAVDPNQMYLAAYEYMFGHYGWAVAATALLVIVSQLKINVTNAYAGSLAWSNFFSRVTHSHPGRVVWMVFNILIALMLMELDVFQALGGVLGLFSNIAISWIMAVVADLVINKPLGWSPPGIEFRRAYLPDINPVGVGAMGLASGLSVAAHLGAFGAMAQAFSALIALVTALLAAPAIAWATRGRYYLARPPEVLVPGRLYRCVVCERDYQAEDMARCPAYGGLICSLCCTLDARCADRCKPQPRLVDWVWQRWSAALGRWLPRRLATRVDTGLGHYLLLMSAIVPLLGALFVLLYRQEVKQLGERGALMPTQTLALLEPVLRAGFLKAYAALLLVASVVAWWLVLAHRSRQVAHEEISRQTDLQLQEAKRQAEAANQAKTRYISAISHELRTPLNSILGYAQLLEEDASMPANRRQAVSVIRRGGDHLLSLIEGTLDIARIESGKLSLEVRPMAFRHLMDEIAGMFELQAQAKGIRFERDFGHDVPEAVRADERRLRQILINLLGNAVKFTHHGGVVFRLRYAREMARLDIVDSGPGMSEAELERVFDPFVRGSAAGGAATGTGLGLTISKMLTELMGGELSARSTPGQGTTFSVRLFLPEVSLARTEPVGARSGPTRVGYDGPRRTILVVDNEEADRAWLADSLQPLGFVIEQAASGEACLARLADLQPDAIFMDLAMPGIDGWETLRRLRAQGLSLAPAAIVSANAFDKGLDNDVGITPADFLVKPVRRADVLDWLGRRLHLQWQAGAPVPQPDAEPAQAAAEAGSNGPRVLPDAVALETLRRVVAMGYPRGILRQLDQIQAERPDTEPFIQRLRPLARAFQFEALDGLLRDALDELRSA